MKKGFAKSIVLRKPKRPNIHIDGKRVLCLTAVVIGVIVGSAIIRRGDKDTVDTLSALLSKVMESYHRQGIATGLFTSFGVGFSLLVLCLFYGLCALGAPAVCCVLTGYGIGAGILGALLCGCFHTKGLGLFTLAFVPYLAITAAALVYAGGESMDLSLALLAGLAGKQQALPPNKKLREFGKRYAAMFLPLTAASLLQSVAFRLFGAIFGVV